jgi:hypothetical protein
MTLSIAIVFYVLALVAGMVTGAMEISKQEVLLMSRKTLLAVLAVITAVMAFFKEQFGLGMDVMAVMGGLVAVIAYILLEAKLDLKKLGAQAGKWKDPKFWMALISVIIAALNKELGLNLPAEAIVAVLTVIMSVLFGIKFKEAT